MGALLGGGALIAHGSANYMADAETIRTNQPVDSAITKTIASTTGVSMGTARVVNDLLTPGGLALARLGVGTIRVTEEESAHLTAPSVNSVTAGATKGMNGRVLSLSEQAEFAGFAKRAQALGLKASPYRTGSWGTFDAEGDFNEVARVDVGEPGKPGWEGETHVHIDKKKDHLPLGTKIPGE